MPLSRPRALALTLAALVASGPAVAQDFTSTEKAQVVGLDGWSTDPLWTVGETIGGYVPPGIPDGTGAIALDERTVRVFLNHELRDGLGYAYTLANGTALRGARVSYFDIDRDSRSLVGSGLAYGTIVDRYGEVVTRAEQVNEGQVGGSDDVLTAGIDRLCSANLFTAGEYGLADPIFFTGEETGNGQEFALDVASGTLYAAPWLGRAAWESVTLLDTGDDDTVAVLIGDDRGGAPLLLYVGTKDPTGDFLARNGLEDGVLHVWVADSGERSPEEWNGTGTTRTGRFVAIDHYDASMAGADGYDAAGFADMGTQDSLAEAVGYFQFSRPEDVSTNPADGTQAVMASTGRSSLFPSDAWGTTYLIDLDFSDAEGGVAAELTVLYDGDDAGNGAFAGPDFGLRSPDNLDWADDGMIYLQEDRSVGGFGDASGEDASIFRLDPTDPTVFTADELERIAQIDIDAVPDGQREQEYQANEIGVRETSGVLDVTSLFETAPGERLFLVDVQAHESRLGSLVDLDLVEGGQLLFMSSPNTDGDIACSAAAPLFFADYDANAGNGVGDDPRGEFAALANSSSDEAVSLDGCAFVVFDPFTERVTYAADATGTVAADGSVAFATSGGGQDLPAGTLPDGPGAFALVSGNATAGQSIGDVLTTADIVAAVVYLDDAEVFGRVGGGGAGEANAEALVAALAQLRATAGEDDGAVALALTVGPNPTSGAGAVRFGLAESGDVRVALYDALGRQVAVLADGPLGVGPHTLALDATSLPAGVYVVRVAAGPDVRTARLTVVR